MRETAIFAKNTEIGKQYWSLRQIPFVVIGKINRGISTVIKVSFEVPGYGTQFAYLPEDMIVRTQKSKHQKGAKGDAR